MAKTAERGRPFKKGQSGNPAGRPKGGSNKKELTLEEEIEALKQRAAEHACAGRLGSARIAWKKFFVLNGRRQDDPELKHDVEEIILLFQTEAEKLQRLDLVKNLFEDKEMTDDGAFFEHIGLPKDVDWQTFRARYAIGDDDVDADCVFRNFTTYPPIAAGIVRAMAAKAKAEGETAN